MAITVEKLIQGHILENNAIKVQENIYNIMESGHFEIINGCPADITDANNIYRISNALVQKLIDKGETLLINMYNNHVWWIAPDNEYGGNPLTRCPVIQRLAWDWDSKAA